MFNGNPKVTTWYHKKDRHHPYKARPYEGFLVGDPKSLFEGLVRNRKKLGGKLRLKKFPEFIEG